MTSLREGLLDRRRIVLAGAVPEAVVELIHSLGGGIVSLESDLDDERGEERARELAPVHALVFGAKGPFGNGGPGGLRDALEQAWRSIRAVAAGALIPGGAGGRVVLLAPPCDAGPLARAAQAGLENLSRTLSVEWARYAITTVAVAPEPGVAEDDLAELIGFLISPGGGYFSGCRLSLGAAVIRAS